MLENSGSHIATILSSTDCRNHDSEPGSPCWDIWLVSNNRYAPAVCGNRIRRAGFNGKIDPKSMSRWTNKDDAKPKSRHHHNKLSAK